MADKVPAPVLDTRNGDALTAQAVGSLPAELNDRSDSNPAVVVIEAVGGLADNLLYQINRWPSAVIQKVLNIVQATMQPAQAATVTQTFTLSAPQSQDTMIPAGSQVGTTDGAASFATLADLTIAGYGNGGVPGAALNGSIVLASGSAIVTSQGAGTVATTSGSATVVGTGTPFTGTDVGRAILINGVSYTISAVRTATDFDISPVAASTLSGFVYYYGSTPTAFTTQLSPGWQISVDKSTWYTIQTITNAYTLTLTAPATSSVVGATFYGGPVTGTVLAQCTVAGAAGNVSAGALNTPQSLPSAVGSTSNASAATGGADAETVDQAVARAAEKFTTRDVAASVSDFETFAVRVLGSGGRARATALMNVTTATPGYTTVALLSPTWTASSPVSAQERASVVRDLAGRVFEGATVVDVAANIQAFTSGTSVPAALVIRKSSYDEGSVRGNVAGAINTLLNPSVYDWGRTIYTSDLVQAVESAAGVDRVLSINGVPCVAMNWNTCAGNITVTSNSATATCSNSSDASAMTAGQTVIIDAANKAAYLVTAKSGTTLTLHTVYTGTTGTLTTPNFMVVGDKALANWYSLPYSSLSTSTSSLPASIVVLGKY